MKKIILAISLSVPGACVNAQYVSLTGQEVQKLRTAVHDNKVFTPIMTTAQAALNQTPNPIEKITSEGLLEGNPAKTASLKAVEDAHKVYCVALVYRLYGGQAYLDKATEFLLAWSKTNKATGDPIDETKLEDMITGYDLVRSEIPSPKRDLIDQWLDSIAQAELTSKSSKPGKKTAINNWNSHRIKIITLVAYTLHAARYDSTIRDEWEKQLAINLNPDGTTLDFIERDAFHYHIYDLEPLLTTAIVLYRATGRNYFDYRTPKDASLRKSVDFMVPFMTGEKTHGEFVNSTVPFDRQRAQNHEKGYIAGTLFEPKNGLFALSLAAFFDPAYEAVIRQVPGEGGNWQLVLDSVRRK